ncbi:MAG TPA: DNA polymerase/3'-5' exonuclease PolX [Phycisphaerae bacterium]|nr:DNA polymerase/3'-5' exonuclease PolX [Phycisphaerae bacterium]HNU44970.1 DNA polymerase/3'-5' exonuclease PolX [Phycisphaerae bacterium]
MINDEVARVLERIADLLEIDGADVFRVNSYRRASRTVKEAGKDVAALAAEDRLTDLPGIGKGTAQRIGQYVSTGHIDVLDELEAKLPTGLPALLDIPGLGPKKVSAMHTQLGVGGLDDLKRVIDSGELQKLPGFGATSVQRITEGIAFLQTSGGRTPLGIALPIAEGLCAQVAALPGVKRVEMAGSLRRGRETIGDVDLLCVAEDGKAVVDAFVGLEGVRRVLAQGATKGSVTVQTDDGTELQVDLRVVAEESFGAAWQYFTGSKDHNVRLREIAVKKKWRLNEYGLYDGERRIAGPEEKQVYAKLGLPWIPPELREDRGEFEPGWQVSELVGLDDIRGDLHVHTDASDGRNTVEEMAHAARDLGYEYIAITDHSRSSTIANGLSNERLKKHLENVRAVGRKLRGLKVLTGCECDILPSGKLDYSDALLAECDWVVASIHSAMGPGGKGKLSPTERTLAAMENPYVHAIGHLTGRLINQRPPMEIDVEAVVQAAARTGTALEVNAHLSRLDLKDLHIRQALAAGVKLVINTDAHSPTGFGQMRYGILTARRGGATRKDVLNCLTWTALRKRLNAKRS